MFSKFYLAPRNLSDFFFLDVLDVASAFLHAIGLAAVAFFLVLSNLLARIALACRACSRLASLDLISFTIVCSAAEMVDLEFSTRFLNFRDVSDGGSKTTDTLFKYMRGTPASLLLTMERKSLSWEATK